MKQPKTMRLEDMLPGNGQQKHEAQRALRLDDLPLPRLQLRWEASDKNEQYQWLCHYELVIPLREFDIRRENCDEKGNIEKGPPWVAIAMKPPTGRGSDKIPCSSVDGADRYYDAPYRDGRHAVWDSEVLGGLPVYVIAPDGAAFANPYPKETPNG